MTDMIAARRPPIHMIDTEADALAALALSVEDKLPDVSALLLDEITRARLYAHDRIAEDVVTMMSTIDFTIEATGTDRVVQLVYPQDADIAAGRISILTPVGASLIGLREGQSIAWPDRSGKERRLKILGVRQA
jgi:regulator of nucleoside diphosphate kinase